MAMEHREAPLSAAQCIARVISGYEYYGPGSDGLRDITYDSMETEIGKLEYVNDFCERLAVHLSKEARRAVVAFLELSRDNTCTDSVRHLFELLGKEGGVLQLIELANVYQATSELRESEEQDCDNEEITALKLYSEILDAVERHKDSVGPRKVTDIFAKLIVRLCLDCGPTPLSGLAYLHLSIAEKIYDYEQKESTDNPD